MKNKDNIMFIIGLVMVLASAVALFIGWNVEWAIPFGVIGIIFIGVGRRKMKKSQP